MFYPFYSKLQQLSADYNRTHGNFSLWFNKLPQLNDSFKIEDDFHRKSVTVYNICKQTDTVKTLLTNKHLDQLSFCESFLDDRYIKKVFVFRSKSRLITGLGQTHPKEAGIVLDHTIGIPYLPASSIKGVARFAATLEEYNRIMESSDGQMQTFNDNTTDIPLIFGGDILKNNEKTDVGGSVIFLDCYPLAAPALTVDIMNPHYPGWYADGKKPPADDQNPVPIKFLTIPEKTDFIMRLLIAKKGDQDLCKKVEECIINAFTREGIGAKTAVGYGLFDLIATDEPEGLKDEVQKLKVEKMSEEELLLQDIRQLQEEDDITTFINNLFTRTEDKPYRVKAFTELKNKLRKITKWKPQGKGKQKEKIRARNERINEVIGVKE